MDEQGKLLDEPGKAEKRAERPTERTGESTADRPAGQSAEEPATNRVGSNIVVGTSGYSFEDWVGNFYPAHIRKGDMLKEYCKHFTVVEVNSTYYRIPHAAVLARMEEKTPVGFEFVIKANQEMTHKTSRDGALYASFKDALKPVIDAGKFGGVIAQFPWGFKPTPEAREHLEFLREKFDEVGEKGSEVGRCPLFVEFRNADWINEDLFESLKARAIGYCSVDEPRLKGLVPPIARVTADIGYVRLHGRNAKNWWGGSGSRGGSGAGSGDRDGLKSTDRGSRGGSGGSGDRYDYLYSEDELKEWVAKIRSMSQLATKTYVFFNNCHAGQAARNANLMKELLRLPL
jgi:uncharacterized protein YecE (DUF72 family)